MKVIIVSTYANKLLRFRRELVESIIGRGHRLTIMGPEPPGDFVLEYAKMGCSYQQIDIDRVNVNPLRELRALARVKKQVQAENADKVLIYGIRLITTCAIAARLAGVKDVYCIVNGAGTLFTAQGPKALIVRAMSFPILASSLRLSQKVFFQNEDDKNDFVRLRLVSLKKAIVINGSGVNLEGFPISPFPNEINFVFVGRMIRDKGVLEYIQAAEIVKEEYPRTKFFMVGQYDVNPSGLTPEEIQPYLGAKIVSYLGELEDVRSILQTTAVLVLPSYREGTPRSVLEAMATGRAIITTDVPGCRHTVVNGMNGFLVPARDAEAVADKMIWMIENKNQTRKMGQESRRICEDKFNVYKVNDVILRTMSLK